MVGDVKQSIYRFDNQDQIFLLTNILIIKAQKIMKIKRKYKNFII